MSHALIIDDNIVISSAIRARLALLGFSSFSLAWTEEQAVAAAAQRTPDLIVVGDEVETGSALSAVRRISRKVDVPVVMVTGDSYRARAEYEKICTFEGPFLLDQMTEALQLARSKITFF